MVGFDRNADAKSAVPLFGSCVSASIFSYRKVNSVAARHSAHAGSGAAVNGVGCRPSKSFSRIKLQRHDSALRLFEARYDRIVVAQTVPLFSGQHDARL